MKIEKKKALFKEISSLHFDKIFRICKAYLYEKEWVDDLFQEVLIHIWNSLDRFKGDASLTTWIYRITLNTTVSFNRKSKKDKALFSNRDLPEMEMAIQPNGPENNAQVDALTEAIHKLKADDRMLISLVLEELSYKEIAAILGISVNLVGVKINRVKKRLTELYHYE